MAKLSLFISLIRLNAIILISLLINNCNCNHVQCPRLFSHVFKGFAPKGNKEAGTYEEVENIYALDDCVKNCCGDIKCNIAFLYNGTCYHVKCASNELCMPMRRTNITAKMLQMVLVNPVNKEDPSWKKILQDVNFADYSNLGDESEEKITDQNMYKLLTMYDTATKESNDKFHELNEVYNNVPYKNFKNFDYHPGLFDHYGPAPDQIMDETNFYPSTIQVHPCISTRDCPPHEQCSEDKTCSCFRNYARNEEGICVRKKALMPSVAAQKLIMRNYNADPDEIFNDGVKTDTTDSSTSDKQLTVSVVSKDVRLPENEATLSAYVIPDEASSGDKYSYLWKLISKPKGDTNGTMTDQTKDHVKLTNLAEGIYRFQVTVTGTISSKLGEAYTNVTVLPQDRRNKPPQVYITPNEQTIKLPNSNAILDGSASSDDDKITSWHWDLVQGPIGYQPNLTETNILQLNNLSIPGNYTFKLTVMDSDKISNYTTATIQILKEIDYPPVANAGQTVILYLPNNNVTLNGSLSKDDHEIVAWEWTKDSKDQSKAVDMQNTRTPYLQLSNLEEGLYTFELKVTDAKNQSSISSVHVFVKMPTNMPPIARAGQNVTISLPQTWAILNGTESKDDIKISHYYWKQISGPTNSLILNANSSTANATGMTIGEYIFELAVIDDGNNNATDRVKITVVQDKNTPPVANGGGDQSITLPVSAVILNGTRSYDDLGIINYTWTREPGSLAIGTIIRNSDREPVLIMTNVITGRYLFKLTVNDGQGLSGSDTVSVIVHPDPLIMSLVELTLTIEATSLNQNELENLQQKLMLLMGDNVKVHIRDLKIERKNGQVVIVFYVEKNIGSDNPMIVSALEVERVLKEKFWRDYSILGTSVSEIRTAICQNNCSNHGVCNEETRACMCQSFWMPDIFYFWGVSEANCDWSILYVIIGIFIVFLLLSGICWGLTCFCRRSASPNKPRARTKPQKYALLGTQEDVTAFNRSGTTMSDSDTDSDVLFESRKQNGTAKLVNGDARNGHKYSMTRLGRRIKA